jgi:hypothetical protein
MAAVRDYDTPPGVIGRPLRGTNQFSDHGVVVRPLQDVVAAAGRVCKARASPRATRRRRVSLFRAFRVCYPWLVSRWTCRSMH